MTTAGGAEVGAAAPPLALPDTEGLRVTLDPAAAPATVVVFTCNHCPYALAWHDRIQDVARDYGGRGVRMLQINSNDAVAHPTDSLEAMARRADTGELSGPYLHDETQEAAVTWGAEVTPEVFVVDRDGVVRYHGAPDADHDDDSLRAGWLRDALDDVLSGREVRLAYTQPSGCTIKWRVELAYWDGCPSHPAALQQVEGLLAELGRTDVRVHPHRVLDHGQAEREMFVGSPTVRVGRRDLVPPGADQSPALTCRVYRTRSGAMSPLPDPADLREGLEAALARPWEKPGWVDPRRSTLS